MIPLFHPGDYCLCVRVNHKALYRPDLRDQDSILERGTRQNQCSSLLRPVAQNGTRLLRNTRTLLQQFRHNWPLRPVRIGDIIVATTHYGLIIKRIVDQSESGFLLEGENKVGVTREQIGAVAPKRILWRVLFRFPRIGSWVGLSHK